MDKFNSTHSDIISSDKVEGTTVYDTAGDKLGSVDDLMIDKRSGQVRYAVLEFGGFLGMGTDRYPLPWDLLKYDVEKGGYMVPLDKLPENLVKRTSYYFGLFSHRRSDQVWKGLLQIPLVSDDTLARDLLENLASGDQNVVTA